MVKITEQELKTEVRELIRAEIRDEVVLDQVRFDGFKF
jgi:hypothetical protein